MSKLHAQEVLINQRVGTFLLRFSETETGGISVAWVTQDANGQFTDCIYTIPVADNQG